MEFDAFQEDPQEFFAEFYTHIASHPSLRYRLKNAWKVFRNKEHWLQDVCMDKIALRELQELLNRKMPEHVVIQLGTPNNGLPVASSESPLQK